MPDKYDEAVAYFQSLPDEEFSEKVYQAWDFPFSEKGGCLFLYGRRPDSSYCGCLTQIKAGEMGPTPELKKRIRKDPKIPEDPRKITKAMLPAFAKYQRIFEKVPTATTESV